VIHIGFTGTRYGMTEQQRMIVQAIVEVLAMTHPITAHHGDCVGADAEFHAIALRAGARLVIHPPVDESHRAFCKPADEWRAALTHLARNRAIVIESTVMIATPYEETRQERGGTWYTVDRAERAGRPLALVLRTPTGARALYSGTWPRSV